MNRRITRRAFLNNAALVLPAAASGYFADSPRHTPRQPLEEFDYAQVRLTGGPLKTHYDRILASYLALDNDRLLKVYRQRAGLPAPGAAMGGWYDADGFVPGHSLGQYISGLARFGRSTGNPACQTKVSELVEGFAATLGPGNRIYAGPDAAQVWPCYVLDKHLAGLIDAYKLTGLEKARELLDRVYRGALPCMPAQGRDRVGKKDPPYDETYILPESLFAAYEITGDRAMYDRACNYLLDRDFFDPLARGEDVLPGRHAYSHAIALSSAARAHLVLGDQKYLNAMTNAWDFLTSTQQYASGGWGPNETFITPHKGELYRSLSATDDHFETPCGSYAAIKFARYLLTATGDGRYGDGLERLVFNTILAVKDPDNNGDYPYYSTYGPNTSKVFYPRKWPCCSGTLAQGVADYVKNIYFQYADGVAVNLYAPSELQFNSAGDAIQLTQETQFPVSDEVTLRFDCVRPAEFALRLRIPAWIDGPPAIRVNGKVASCSIERGFAVLRRTWRTGDTVTLNLRQGFRTEPIDDLHPRTVAILRGPLVYVELNPAPDQSGLVDPGKWQPVASRDGYFSARAASGGRTYAPLYFVKDERYTTYFDLA